jgi:hypothetical protein
LVAGSSAKLTLFQNPKTKKKNLHSFFVYFSEVNRLWSASNASVWHDLWCRKLEDPKRYPMNSIKSYKLAPVVALALLCAQSAHANVLFHFTQAGSDVKMTSSGTLDTSKLLVSTFSDGWGGTGVENNTLPGDIDIMGGTAFGGVDTLFKFHASTDDSAISNPGGPFSFSNFNWTVTSGSKSFATYAGFDGGFRQAGIGVRSVDIVGGQWTPDQNWTSFGATFASLGLNVGTYSVSDSVTSETITIQVGGSASVPDGGTTFVLLCGAFAGLLGLRRRFAA